MQQLDAAADEGRYEEDEQAQIIPFIMLSFVSI